MCETQHVSRYAFCVKRDFQGQRFLLVRRQLHISDSLFLLKYRGLRRERANDSLKFRVFPSPANSAKNQMISFPLCLLLLYSRDIAIILYTLVGHVYTFYSTCSNIYAAIGVPYSCSCK